MGFRQLLRRVSIPCFAAGVLLMIAPSCSLIRCVFTSPQYPTKSPQLSVYASKIVGSTQEFEILSRYVGIQFPPDVPELKNQMVPWIFVSLGILAIVASFLPVWPRRSILIFIVLGLTALASLGQYRMHQSGHNINPEAPMRQAVKPFTPPLFGKMTIRKIEIYHIPDVGSVMILIALTGLAIGWKRRRSVPA